jgi:hypothetical protein
VSTHEMPRSSTTMRESMDRHLEDWTALAACRPEALGGQGPQDPGFPWNAAWLDDVSSETDPAAYEWPESVKEVLKACAGCPVRRPCLELGYAKWVFLGETEFYGEHTPECNRAAISKTPARWEARERAQACPGCLEPAERMWLQEFDHKPMPAGVYGGVPAPIRQHFAEMTCPRCAGKGWHTVGFMLDGVDVAHLAAPFHEPRRGWPCEDCKGEGTIARPDRLERCTEWADAYFAEQGWTDDDVQEVSA